MNSIKGLIKGTCKKLWFRWSVVQHNSLNSKSWAFIVSGWERQVVCRGMHERSRPPEKGRMKPCYRVYELLYSNSSDFLSAQLLLAVCVGLGVSVCELREGSNLGHYSGSCPVLGGEALGSVLALI